jgi:hypothetical protein
VKYGLVKDSVVADRVISLDMLRIFLSGSEIFFMHRISMIPFACERERAQATYATITPDMIRQNWKENKAGISATLLRLIRSINI